MIFGNHDARLHFARVPSVLAGRLATVVLLVLAAVWPVLVQAQSRPVLALTGPVDSTALVPFIEYIMDPDWDMAVSDLAAPGAPGWQPLPDTGVDFGYTSARIWLRVALVNRSSDVTDWRVFSQANFWPTLQVWRVGEGGRIDTLIDLGADSPFDARPIALPQLAVPLSLAPGEAATLILSYSSQGSSRNAISIETADSFDAMTTRSTAKTYMFYGMILALLAVTSIAVIVLQQVLHVVYATYVVSLFLYLAHIDGTTFQLLWPDHPALNGMASVVIGAAVMVSSALFAMLYLQTRRYHPVMHWLLAAAVVIVLGVVVTLWSVDPQRLKQMMVVMILLNALVILAAAIVAALQRFQEVKYYLFAWLASLFPAALFTARHIFSFETGLIATYDAVRTALVFDAYMMGFAAIDQLRRSRERALAESLALARRNLMLGERLAVLDQSYETLANQARLREEDVKDAVHDLRQPMHALRLSMRQRLVEGHSGKDTSQFEAALAYMEQLVADRLAKKPDAARPADAAPAAEAARAREPGLHDVLRGVAEMFGPEAEAKGLRLKLRLGAPDGPVEAYPLMRALANLVSNAIKYTRQGRVLITLRRTGTGWRVEVHDTGPGLDPSQFALALERNARLDRDRPEAEGSGLGLAIAQDIVTTQGWTMTPCRRRTAGASILLDLPAAARSQAPD